MSNQDQDVLDEIHEMGVSHVVNLTVRLTLRRQVSWASGRKTESRCTTDASLQFEAQLKER